eukprot:c15572_g1_i1 orf=1107-2030(+)
MVSIGALGIGLSFVFGGFVLVLLAELYYMLFWKKQPSSSIWKTNTDKLQSAEQGSSCTQIAALADSFGGSPRFPTQSELMTKFFSVYPSDVTSQDRFQFYATSLLLFPIMEETKEDMESEDGKFKGSTLINRVCTRISSVPLAHFLSESSPCEDTPLSTPTSSPFVHSPRTASPLTPRNDSQNSSLTRFAARAVQATSVSITKSPGGIVKEAVPFTSHSKGSPAETCPNALVFSPFSSPNIISLGSPMQPATEKLKVLIDMSPILGAPHQYQKLSTPRCYPPPQIGASSRAPLRVLLNQSSPIQSSS